MIKRALISVYDKKGIVEFAKELEKLGVEIISTGGTYKALKDEGINAIKLSDETGFPEILGGRVKTLHPKIHGGILAIRNNKEHIKELEENQIKAIDLVVVNLYPFKETVLKEGVALEEVIENIDIGGPTMLRAAAKNWQDVAVVINPNKYIKVIEELNETKDIQKDTRLELAAEVFQETSYYDSLINNYLKEKANIKEFPKVITLPNEKIMELRYGENPHQKAAFYKETTDKGCNIANVQQLHGKELSFNNINDANAALELVLEFDEPAAVGIKHANPCGVACSDNIYDAYKKAYECDPVSIFGGIVALNRKVDLKTAGELNSIFLEIVIAPDYDNDALEKLKEKKNLRILKLPGLINPRKPNMQDYDIKRVRGGLLLQDNDDIEFIKDFIEVDTIRKPTDKEIQDLIFAWKVVKHTKSNAIVLAKDKQTVGIGPGQVNRIWATKHAIERAGEKAGKSVLASDAFFPFPDVVNEASKAGITAIIQPGGSIKDKDSIEAADNGNISMVFTGIRHFKH